MVCFRISKILSSCTNFVTKENVLFCKMGRYFVIFCLFLIGFCTLSLAAPNDYPWANSFVLPNRNSPAVPNRSSLGIIGGEVASPHMFPYQVGMYVDSKFETAFCGGSLISANYVLTAAHCVEQAVSINMIFGAHNISDDSESARQQQTSESYVVHPEWDVSTLSNDLAIIKFDKPVTLNRYVQVVEIASGDETYAGKGGTATGWGKTGDNSPRSDLLMFTSNSILSNADCKASSSDYDSVIRDTHLCFSGEGYKGICKGDSGGPLTSNGIQIGVTSFSYKSCEAGMPSVFTRLSKYVDWIKANSDIKTF